MGYRTIGTAGGAAPEASRFARTYGAYGLLQGQSHTTGSSVSPTTGPNGTAVPMGTASANLAGFFLAIDIAASQRPVMMDVLVDGTRKARIFTGTANNTPMLFDINIAVASGQAVTVNMVGVLGTLTYTVSAFGYECPSEAPYAEIEALGPLGSTIATTGTVIDLTSTSWVQITAAGIANAQRALRFYCNNNNLSSSRTAGRFFLDISVGESGAQTVVIPTIPGVNTTSAAFIDFVPGPYLIELAAATKIWARKSPTVGDAFAQANDKINLQVMGYKST